MHNFINYTILFFNCFQDFGPDLVCTAWCRKRKLELFWFWLCFKIRSQNSTSTQSHNPNSNYHTPHLSHFCFFWFVIFDFSLSWQPITECSLTVNYVFKIKNTISNTISYFKSTVLLKSLNMEHFNRQEVMASGHRLGRRLVTTETDLTPS